MFGTLGSNSPLGAAVANVSGFNAALYLTEDASDFYSNEDGSRHYDIGITNET